MSLVLIKWIRYFSLEHLPRNDLKSKGGRVAWVERFCKKVSCKESYLPVDNLLIETNGYTADTAVMAKFGCLRIQRAYKTDVFKSEMKPTLFKLQLTCYLENVQLRGAPTQLCKSDWGRGFRTLCFSVSSTEMEGDELNF